MRLPFIAVDVVAVAGLFLKQQISPHFIFHILLADANGMLIISSFYSTSSQKQGNLVIKILTSVSHSGCDSLQ